MKHTDTPSLKPLEIGTDWWRPWLSRGSYLFALLGLAAVIVFVFVQLDTSLRMAMGVVCFMLAYMLLVGWITARNTGRWAGGGKFSCNEKDDRRS